jgi:hypothetical protein
LAGGVVEVCAVALEVPELDGPALDACALEAALEAALDTAAALDEVTPLALPGALETAPSGAAWW